ncbi:hypothetical protein KIN20_017612 [Parelaphostrongylus tenuis]|uniref:Uncharacterized protein n=1 Tax=Parelaphostrongylus tenuis TaxID=148309 RepID=A0AAD5MLR8_PARTN|nr:hypothetical protein KIN20_017612 [Parelaphostrongylus tenuis]
MLEESTADKASQENNKDNAKKDEVRIEMQDDFIQELKSRSSEQECATSTAEKRPYNIEYNGGVLPVKKLSRITESDDDNGGIGTSRERLSQPVEQPVSKGSKFFVTGDEPHLQSLVNNFKRTQSLEKIVSRWANHRDIFMKNYKHLRKVALKEGRRNLLRSNHETSDNSGSMKKRGKKRQQKGSVET